jgi:outer membrane protein TolC
LPVETRLGAQRFKIGVAQPIPWKGLLNAKKSLAESQADVKASLDDIQEIDIEYSIRSAYSTLIFMEAKKEVIREKLEILNVLEELSKSNLRAGKGKLSNVLMVQRQREGLMSDLSIIEKQKDGPTISINRLTGRALDSEIDLQPQLDLIKSTEEYMRYANEDHPQLDVLRKKKLSSGKAVELLAFEEKPKIGLGLEYSWIERRPDVTIPNNGRDILMPMGSISIPIHTNRYAARRQEEKLKQESYDAVIQDMQDMYKMEIAKAESTIQWSQMNIDKINGLRKITAETIQLLRSEYASEGTRFEELLRLEMELTDYNLQIAITEFDIHLAQATLKKYE